MALDHRRLFVLDGLRGLLLIVIGINHYGGSIAKYLTSEPVGFVSAAEGFVFIAGFVLSLTYGARMLRDPLGTCKKLLQRTLTIYLWFEATSVILVVVAQLSPFYRNAWVTLLDLEPTSFAGKVGATILLSYQPSYLQILVMYSLLFFVAPAILWLVATGNGRKVILISGLIYLVQPFGITDRFFSGIVFPLLTWQFLFVLGIALGYKYAQGKLNLTFRRSNVLGAIALCSTLFLLREAVRFDLLGEFGGYIELAFNKRHLSPLRLINFFLLAYLLAGLAKVHPKWLNHRWLVLIGQSSLYIFVFQAVVIYFWRPLRVNINLSLESLVFAGLTIVPVLLHRAWRESRVASTSRPALDRPESGHLKHRHSRS